MKISKILVSNFRSCDKTVLNLNNELTALIGTNGSGKTNILSAIKLLKALKNDRSYYRFQRTKQNDGLFETNITVDFIEKEKVIQLKADFHYDVGSDTEESISFIDTSWKIPELELNKWVKVPVDFLNPHSVENLNNILRTQSVVGSPQLKKMLVLWKDLPAEFFKIVFSVLEYVQKINYYSATQFSNPQKCPTSIEFDDRERKNHFRNNRRGSHSGFIADIIRLKKSENEKYQRFVNLIGPNGISLIDSITFEEVEFSSEEVNVKSGGKIVTDKRIKLIIVPKIFIGNKTLSFNQLSEGTFKTIALLFYIIQSDNPLLLVEEPEVCVHHGLLKSVIEIIKSESKGKQIIISTHSDFVLDQLSPENVIIVTKDNKKGTLSRPLTTGMKSENYKALHDYLNSVGNLGEYWKEGGFDV